MTPRWTGCLGSDECHHGRGLDRFTASPSQARHPPDHPTALRTARRRRSPTSRRSGGCTPASSTAAAGSLRGTTRADCAREHVVQPARVVRLATRHLSHSHPACSQRATQCTRWVDACQRRTCCNDDIQHQQEHSRACTAHRDCARRDVPRAPCVPASGRHRSTAKASLVALWPASCSGRATTAHGLSSSSTPPAPPSLPSTNTPWPRLRARAWSPTNPLRRPTQGQAPLAC